MSLIRSLWILLPLLLVLLVPVVPPCSADTQSELITLNNDGVKALNEKKWQLGIDKFKEALSLDPTYQLARDNLVIAYRNWGEEFRIAHKSEDALKQFHQAIYWRGHWADDLSQTNLDNLLNAMGKNPKSFADRSALGDRAQTDGDLIGAVVEYDAAAQLQNDPRIHKTLARLYRQLGQANKAAIEEKEAAYGETYRDQLDRGPEKK